MNSPLCFFLSRILTVFLLACGFIPASARAQGFTAPTLWTLESLQDADSDWWQSLRVQTVPGVVYKLQKSNTLAEGSWENIATHYGSDSEWICPIMPGTEPVAPPPPGAPQIPVSSSFSWHVNLILETSHTGGTLVSWTSLDNGALLRMVLPGVTLDPVWEEYDSFYLNAHGGYLFALSPRLYPSVNFTGSAPTLGPLDTAMVAGFIAALPTITSELETSVANAASYTPVPEDPDSKGFFRIHANWQVDSDGDGRLDWEEIIFDNNNPFCADTDGDGENDVAQDNNGPLPSLDDDSLVARSVSATSQITPQAVIEQIDFQASRSEWFFPNDPDWEEAVSSSSDHEDGTAEVLKAATSYGNFNSIVKGFAIPPEGHFWSETLRPASAGNYKVFFEDEPENEEDDGNYGIFYASTKSFFRLHLDSPAPTGGYRIPLRLAKVTKIHGSDGEELGVLSSESVEIILEVAEGQMVGNPVELTMPDNVAENRSVSYIPGYVSAQAYSRDENEEVVLEDSSDGVCILPGGGIWAVFNGFTLSSADDKIYWRKRRLNGGGTFDLWEKMFPEGSAEPYEGQGVFLNCEDPGIYQFQALYVFANGSQVEFPYLRMRDAKSIRNRDDDENPLLKAGQPDYFGVAQNSMSLALRNEAIKWLGSTAYSQGAKVTTQPGSMWNPSTVNRPKCNLFVTHISNRLGATTPYFVRRIMRGFGDYPILIPSAPIAKDDWFTQFEVNIDLDGPGWVFEGPSPTPSPGMSVASPRTSAGVTFGHVGFMDYDGSWINAGGKTVNKFIHLADDTADYKPNNLRVR